MQKGETWTWFGLHIDKNINLQSIDGLDLKAIQLQLYGSLFDVFKQYIEKVFDQLHIPGWHDNISSIVATYTFDASMFRYVPAPITSPEVSTDFPLLPTPLMETLSYSLKWDIPCLAFCNDVKVTQFGPESQFWIINRLFNDYQNVCVFDSRLQCVSQVKLDYKVEKGVTWYGCDDNGNATLVWPEHDLHARWLASCSKQSVRKYSARHGRCNCGNISDCPVPAGAWPVIPKTNLAPILDLAFFDNHRPAKRRKMGIETF